MSQFDVFEVLTDGGVLWHQALSDFHDAQKLAEDKARATKNTFFVFHQSTQEKIFVEPTTLPLQAR